MYRSRKRTMILKAVKHPGNTIEIQFRTHNFNFLPGQYVFLNVPDVSPLQWHPFTLTSCPEENFQSVHIRMSGDWTKKLGYRLGSHADNILVSAELPSLYVDGPFGTPSQEVFQYETVVLIGAGIGITPFASILKSLWYERRQRSYRGPIRKVHVIWICRSTEDFSWFQSLLSELEQESANFLDIQIYMTGNLQSDSLNNITIQADQKFDSVTQLRTPTFFGRPNFHHILHTVRALAITDPNREDLEAGVFFCGPLAVRHALRRTIDDLTDPTFKFHTHYEKF
jgi:NADPH oxidase